MSPRSPHQWLFSFLLTIFLASPIIAQIRPSWVPCPELNADLRYPCRCLVEVDASVRLGIRMDCDRVVFAGGEFPPLPYGAPVVSFSQRWAGYQALPTQIFSSYGLPMRDLDFSANNLRRLPERLLSGVKENLTRLVLADNLLGDGLNPIFSTSEFHGLAALQELDLSGNGIRGIEEGLLIGCDDLRIFRLDRNYMSTIPSLSLNGPIMLRILSLRENRIPTIRSNTFSSQRSLEEIDLTGNMLSSIEGGSFSSLSLLRSLALARNKLAQFNSDVFHGAETLESLDLAQNFISEFPSVAVKAFTGLKHLNLSANMISTIDSGHISALVSLQVLDLSRNNIAKLSPGTFVGLSQLRYLDVGVNALRTIEDDAFDGLTNLETLLLRDNNILLIPATALSRLPSLVSIQLGYNRVTALSSDILRSMSEKVTSLVLARNVIRELPLEAFTHFKTLTHLDLSGNLLNSLSADVFTGLESSLEYLSVAQNRILGFAGAQLQFLNLWFLDMSDNQIAELLPNSFSQMPNLAHLNVSHNQHLNMLPYTLLHHSAELVTLDLSHTGLRTIPSNFFAKSSKIVQIFLGHNTIQELSEGTFKNLRNLTLIDLSYNNIVNIRQGAFVNIMSIQQLILRGNQMNAFKGEFFNTGTSLEVLDLSDNQLSYLFPSSFKIHPRLKKIILSNNKFNFFPSELINSLQFLEEVDLSGNVLKSIEELDFARLPRLRIVKLANNELESISEMAFHNSTQLQILDFSYNKIDRLNERTFEGLTRLELLDLAHNLLYELPESIFERSRLQMLEKINLAYNVFEIAPLKALQKQYFFVSSVDLSHNQIVDIPSDDSVMVNIKKLDVSFNPLSKQSITNVLSEPKTVRDLNLAGTGISVVTQLETPFLHRLNLSYNNITQLTKKSFIRTTLLESLDLSHNKLTDVSGSLVDMWPKLKNLHHLNLSDNPIATISQTDFEGLTTLQLLSIENLLECKRIEKNAFQSLTNLAELKAYNYPRLGYLDMHGILQNLPILEKLDIEVKDNAISSDQLRSALHPRLTELSIRGSRLKTISSGALAGLKSPNIVISLRNTSLTALPPTLLFPLPRSSRITLDVTGSQLTTLQPQFLVALDDRRADLSMFGLDSNPIQCDCGARALRRWLPSAAITDITCASPDYLSGLLLVEIGDDELTCNARKKSTMPSLSTTLTTKPPRLLHKTSLEPDIIWSVAPSLEDKPKTKNQNGKIPMTGQSTLNNDDTLIISIVGGVVAFIAILIIIICIVRLKMTSTQYRGGPMASGTPIGPMPPLYAVSPSYGMGSAYGTASLGGATLPHKLAAPPGPGSARSVYGSLPPRMSYYPAPPPPSHHAALAGQPYFISLPPHDEKIYR